MTPQPKHGEVWLADLGHLRFLDDASVANVQGIASLPLVRLVKRLGVLPSVDLARVKAAIQWACELV